MTLADIAEDGFKPSLIIGNFLYTTNAWSEVFESHRFPCIDFKHWTIPIKIGRARKSFATHCEKKLPIVE